MAFQQSMSEVVVRYALITAYEFLGCLTMDELFDGSSCARAMLAPEDGNPLFPKEVPSKPKVFQHEHGVVRETVVRWTLGDRGLVPHRMILATSKYTGEAVEFFTYKLASFWMTLIGERVLSETKRRGEKWQPPIAIPGMGQLQQLIHSVVQPQSPASGA